MKKASQRLVNIATALRKIKDDFLIFSDGMVNTFKEPVQAEDERFFSLKAVLTSLWVPCVVGRKEQPRTFAIAAASALGVRTMAVFAALMIAG